MALTRATDKIVGDSNGNLNLSGIVTASSFVGSGSGLTGVASTDHIKTSTNAVLSGIVTAGTLSVSGVSTFVGVGTFESGLKIGPTAGVAGTFFADGSYITAGIITATTFHGSGANLTGLSGVSVANQADNRLITATGTTDALNGEANLTFNGSALTVTGNISLPDSTAPDYVGNIYVGNSSDLKIFHNGSDNFIRSGAGNAKIRIDNNSGVLGARFIPGGASELYNNGTKRIETTSSGVDVAGSLTLTGNIVMSSAASGQGIDFSASGYGASASSELFDDYEEGTYVPTDVSGQSISLTINSTTTYTKIGRLVHVVFDVSWPGGFSGSGNAGISIPFALGVNYGTGNVGWNQVNKPLQCHVNSGGIQIMHNDSGGAKHLSNNDVSGNRLIGAATYFTGT